MDVNFAVKSLKEIDATILHDRIPTGPKENVYFLINNQTNVESRSKGSKSSFEDDCGAWDSTKAPTLKTTFVTDNLNNLKHVVVKNGLLCLKKQVDGTQQCVPLEPQPDPISVLTVFRHYATLKSDKTYKKRVTWLENSIDQVALVEYTGTFPGRLAHGNAKHTDDSYCRTPSETMSVIAKEAKTRKNPKEIYHSLLNQGDILAEPRNTKQIHNKKYNDMRAQRSNGQSDNRANVADEVLAVMNMAQTNPFVRYVIMGKHRVPSVILYTNEQISLMKNLCFDKQLGSVLSIDKTFNLGSIYVTVVVFTNKVLLRRTTGDQPIFIGPLFLHGQSDFPEFHLFLSHLSACFVDCDTTQLRLGSDEEHALRKAMHHAFPRAQLLACTRHLKENTQRHLQDTVGLGKKARNEIINKIYGKDGLTSLTDVADFEDRCANISETVVGHGGFQTYFESKSVLLKDNLLAGYPQWTSNNVESVNHVFKQAVNWQPHMLPDLISKLQKLVETQTHDAHRAVIGRGDYMLQKSHTRYRLTAETWSNMTEGERTKHVLKTFVLDPRNKTVKSTNGKLTVTCDVGAGKKPNQRKRKRCARTVTPCKKTCRSNTNTFKPNENDNEDSDTLSSN